MVVPGLVPGENGDKSHPALDEAAGQKTPGPEVLGLLFVDPVHPESRFALLTDVEGLLRRNLHAGGEFETLDAGFKLTFAGPLLKVPAVETIDKTEISLLCVPLQRHGRIEIEDAGLLGPNHGALINRRQPAVRKVVDPEHGKSAGISEGHIGGEILVLRAESV